MVMEKLCNVESQYTMAIGRAQRLQHRNTTYLVRSKAPTEQLTMCPSTQAVDTIGTVPTSNTYALKSSTP